MRKISFFRLLITALLLTGFYKIKAQVNARIPDTYILFRAEKALTDVMVHDIFSPPVASRIYAYANIATYEVLVKHKDAHYRSLYGQIASFPRIGSPRERIDESLAAIYAFMLVGKKMVFSEEVYQDSIKNILSLYEGRKMNESVYKSSLRYGKQVSDTILRWAGQDHYEETRKLRRYRFRKEEGKWIPTPPAYMAAVEPYWNKIRPMVLDSADQFRPPGAPPFSKDTGSIFYKQAYDVFQTVNNLSEEQKNIANFWDCNPFAVNMEGHLNFAIKKISPGGHWISIVGSISRQKDLGLIETAAAYALTSIAIFDAFISCWDEKYRSNVIRPETYINDHIDESWRPVLQTPPFPEYTSGHSIVSAASATVLTRLLGDKLSFDDDTEQEYGLPVRHFDSIWQAANEAAISRLYGGIHYRAAIVNGKVDGERIGQWVLQKIALKK